jgi:putative membrane protein
MIGANAYQRRLALAFVVFAAALCIEPPYPRDEVLQQTPVVLSIAALAWSSKRFPLSNLSFSLVIAFLCVHSVGARWIYSFVPYDAWTSRLFGFELTEVCGFRRNHYDRLAHFGFGLLLVWPTRELLTRVVHPARALASLLAFALIVAFAALYELGEWIAAITLAPDWAERYLGQQGDPWDAQWDMALAAVGAVFTLLFAAVLESRARATDRP